VSKTNLCTKFTLPMMSLTKATAQVQSLSSLPHPVYEFDTNEYTS